MTISVDTSVLMAYLQAKTGQPVTTGSTAGDSASSTPAVKYAPTPPWYSGSGSMKAPELDARVLAGGSFINQNAAKLDLPGASADYKKLFTLYEGLNALNGLAETAAGKTTTPLQLTQLQAAFQRGVGQITDYVNTTQYSQLRLTAGGTASSEKNKVVVPQEKDTYVTRTLFTGSVNDEVPAFQGDVSFNISATRLGVSSNIAINLSDLGSAPRTISNVVNLINSKLQAAGLVTRFAVSRTPAPPNTIKSGNNTITLPATGDAFALQIKGDSAEKVTLSGANPRPAVYVSTSSGDPNPDKNILTSDAVLQSSVLKVDPSAATLPGSRIETTTLEGTVGAVHASQVGADGRLYVLADVTGTVSGQTINGNQDAALLSYDSAGNLLYARTLGASSSADGLSLAVSADGHVAIAGSVTGALNGATNGPVNSTAASGATDSFVTLYDAQGNEVWTQRRGALQNDKATALAFGDNNVVYVAGTTQSSMPGASSSGGYDGYLTAVATNAKGVPATLFTQQFGTSGNDTPAGIAVNGSTVTVASNENGSAVLRSFDVSQTQTKTTKTWASGVETVTVDTITDGSVTNSQSNQYPTPGASDATTTASYVSAATATVGATRNLGDLQGGTVAGLVEQNGRLYIAGGTHNGALAVGNTTLNYSGGLDAFAATISNDLTDTSQDTLAYYGGAGDNTVTGMAVANGNVYVTGSAGADLPGLTAVGQKDAYMAQIDVAGGAIVASQRITGKDGYATGTSIAVNPNGTSDLDKLGLPAGTLNFAKSKLLVSATSARAGEQFQIRTRAGAVPTTITIDANETLDTLATKIKKATGYAANVSVVSSGNGQVLKISPNNTTSTIEILAGTAGEDVLGSLGLSPGVVYDSTLTNGKPAPTPPGGPIYGLSLDPTLNLSTPDEIKTAQSALANALTQVRIAYQALVKAATPQSAQPAKPITGTVPAYLQAQIANYQAGLARLMQGS